MKKKLENIPPPPYIRLKIISMGEKSVGKSCIIKRYCEKRFISKYVSTIGVDYGVKNVKVDGKELRINFWDLSGHREYFEIRNEFYGNAQGAILVFDITSTSSFDKLEFWLKEMKKYSGKNIPVVIAVGNKNDSSKRKVSYDKAESWAEEKGYKLV